MKASLGVSGCADGEVVATATWEECPKVGDRLGNAGTKIAGVSLLRRTAGLKSYVQHW